MEKSKEFEIEVDCPLHPSHRVQAVNLGKTEGQLLFCLQCMFQQKDFSIMSHLKPFPEVIAKAAEAYNAKKEISKPGEKPKEYLEILSGQAEMMEKLNKHIEEEKKRTGTFFELMQQRLVTLLEERKAHCLKELDDQMITLHDYFASFEKQLDRLYPSQENLHYLFPSKAELEERLRNSTDFDRLKAFVKDLKEDLQVDEIGNEETKKADLKRLAERLLNSVKQKPCYPKNDLILYEFEKFSESLEEFFKKKVYLVDSIGDSTDAYFKGSIIVSREQADIVKNWLPSNTPFNPKLIYQSSRDGRSPAIFHQLCDGKKNTIFLLSVAFARIRKAGILGGFLDGPWSSDDKAIFSEKAFLFSLLTNEKCNVKKGKYAAKGKAEEVIIFGEGYDLYVSFEEDKSYLTFLAESYAETEKLIPTSLVSNGVFSAAGVAPIIIVELEVYTLD